MRHPSTQHIIKAFHIFFGIVKKGKRKSNFNLKSHILYHCKRITSTYVRVFSIFLYYLWDHIFVRLLLITYKNLKKISTTDRRRLFTLFITEKRKKLQIKKHKSKKSIKIYNELLQSEYHGIRKWNWNRKYEYTLTHFYTDKM